MVIPPPGRQAVLQELHEGHPGMSRMKSLARMYVWWPGIDADIEKSVRVCNACQEVQSSPPAAPLNPWKWPTKPWSRLHLDYAGPFENRMFLILIDAHSKWIEAFCTPNATSKAVMAELRTVFARFGVPETVVTDNGTCFVSDEFEHFLSKNGIKHHTSAPYHPASNGLAERAVQIVKRGLKKVTSGDITSRLAKVLFTYRMAPQATTGVSPCELLVGRRPRSRLDLLMPDTTGRVVKKQLQQKTRHDATAKARDFMVGEAVFVKNFSRGAKWLSGTVTKVTGPVSYQVKLEDGRIRRCHQDQIRIRIVAAESLIAPEVEPSDELVDVSFPAPALLEEAPPSAETNAGNVTRNAEPAASTGQPPPNVEPAAVSTSTGTESSAPPVARSPYPVRVRKQYIPFEPGL